MKTEKQIAEEKIEVRSFISKPYREESTFCEQHKATCQRFLEFLEHGVFIYDGLLHKDNKGMITSLKNKITDLKQAIKLYEDAGI